MENLNEIKSGITYSCYHQVSREGEHFVPFHTLSFQIAGSLKLFDGRKEYVSQINRFRFIKRNQLVKFIKTPPAQGQFESISIYFDQESLKKYSLDFGITADTHADKQSIFSIAKNEALENYIQTLLLYKNTGDLENKNLVKLKIQEGLMLLLKTEPVLKNILFDFSEPFKIDLEAFMNQNYTFNVHVEKFAYLTGRSLATFKRDFEKIFNSSPRKWLQQKRLEQAHYLISQKGKTVSDIYLDLGFEDIAHFSHAFKKEFGVAPSLVNK
ncbi:helix-turn-helix domain-containing protein [Rhizosphaericola mali]|uniref:Helix-turn-helix transcriptional regulator n=1 Tax=Rhizosphaericola mali TaxID=2545455 RepID=A0A5P2FYZ3_9BACT|nr:AraC family transcriptional regulator [Rhizosphaericola mali]QES88425.1 helix-turn-helix transcriptional regulator [Rhizosphaericola mali]